MGRRLYEPYEYDSHKAVADLLKLNCQRGWDWTHFPAGENRTGLTGARLKAMGLQRGWPDFLLIGPTGRLHCLEMKRRGEPLSFEQRVFRDTMQAKKVPWAVCYSFEQALSVLLGWGVLRRMARVAA